MIIDRIKNWPVYFSEHIGKEIFQELANYNSETPDGTYKKHSDSDFYFKVMTYETLLEPSQIESHIKEVDIQILLSGSETIKIFDSTAVSVTKDYDEPSDCQLYKSTSSAHSEITLKPGMMAIFFPDDIHFPQFASQGKKEIIKKIVIKVNEKFFTLQ